MSDASVQFVELVRQAHARLQVAVQLMPGQMMHWCDNCGQDTAHDVHDLGPVCEKFTCCVCGSEQTYHVR